MFSKQFFYNVYTAMQDPTPSYLLSLVYTVVVLRLPRCSITEKELAGTMVYRGPFAIVQHN